MEFFIPGIAALIFASIIAFFVVPKMGTPVILVISLVLLAYGFKSHMDLFDSEYRYSTWQDQIKKMGPYALVGVMLFFALLYVGFLYVSGDSSVTSPTNVSIPALPSAESATNPFTSMINNTLRSTNNAMNKGMNIGSLIRTPGNNRV
jgi:uncharacterized membrane protein